MRNTWFTFSVAEKEYRASNDYRKFRRQLFHTSLTCIFERMRHAMIKPIKVKCNDGNYRRAIFGFGSYIADNPEQNLVACTVQGWCPKYALRAYLAWTILNFSSRCLASPGNIDDPTQQITPRTTEHTVQVSHDSELLHAWDTFGIISDIVVCLSFCSSTVFINNNTSLNWQPFTEFFPHADIYESITPDILHQLVKGVFKDHLVTWIGEYLKQEYRARDARIAMDNIDRR